MNKSYKGKYLVENKEKYIGTKQIIYRSSWECKVCKFFDMSDNILKWSYESIVIPYVNVIDGKTHRYYPDFYIEKKNKNGTISKVIVEVKPKRQTLPPKEPKTNNWKSKRQYMYDAETFVINQCKWKSASAYCDKYGYEFQIITEDDII